MARTFLSVMAREFTDRNVRSTDQLTDGNVRATDHPASHGFGDQCAEKGVIRTSQAHIQHIDVFLDGIRQRFRQ